MKGNIKAHTADKYLKPIRRQLSELIKPQSTVLELGCGNGDLLLRLGSKISSGTGLDHSATLINYAMDQKKKIEADHLEFKVYDILDPLDTSKHYDYIIISLVFHLLPWERSIELINELKMISKTIIICGFAQPQSRWQHFLLWLDQRFSGHYSNFRDYQNNGNLKGLLKDCDENNYQCLDTFDPVIKIYKVNASQQQ